MTGHPPGPKPAGETAWAAWHPEKGFALETVRSTEDAAANRLFMVVTGELRDKNVADGWRIIKVEITP